MTSLSLIFLLRATSASTSSKFLICRSIFARPPVKTFTVASRPCYLNARDYDRVATERSASDCRVGLNFELLGDEPFRPTVECNPHKVPWLHHPQLDLLPMQEDWTIRRNIEDSQTRLQEDLHVATNKIDVLHDSQGALYSGATGATVA